MLQLAVDACLFARDAVRFVFATSDPTDVLLGLVAAVAVSLALNKLLAVTHTGLPV